MATEPEHTKHHHQDGCHNGDFGRAADTLAELLPISASSNSMPFGRSILIRCGLPLTGLRMDWVDELRREQEAVHAALLDRRAAASAAGGYRWDCHLSGPAPGDAHQPGFTPPAGASYPVRQMMQLIENIAAKQTAVPKADWTTWCSRFEQCLTQAAGSQVCWMPYRSVLKPASWPKYWEYTSAMAPSPIS